MVMIHPRYRNAKRAPRETRVDPWRPRYRHEKRGGVGNVEGKMTEHSSEISVQQGLSVIGGANRTK